MFGACCYADQLHVEAGEHRLRSGVEGLAESFGECLAAVLDCHQLMLLINSGPLSEAAALLASFLFFEEMWDR